MSTISQTMAQDHKKSVNVLSLDGGGVRGLSALKIVRKLLCMVNQKLNPTTHNNKPIHPTKVFDLIVGTSTGGLIALMMVKLDMDVDDCIEQYKKLSRKVFRRRFYNLWHHFGKLTGGLGPATKFCSTNLRKVLLEHVIQPALQRGHTANIHVDAEGYMMEDIDSHPNVVCTVVCNELHKTTMHHTQKTFFICSHWNSTRSGDPLICKPCCRKANNSEKVPVIDAAQATSAAPTYFRPVRLLDRLLVDGGYGQTNNPSEAAYEHYFWELEKPKSDYHRINMVNIGTGTDPENPTEVKASILDYIPLARIVGDLAKLATESEKVGRRMNMQSETAKDGIGPLRFARFSANRGDIHGISLGAYKALQHIEESTDEYLADPEVLRRLDEFAEQLAETCRTRDQQDTPVTEPQVVISTITERAGKTQITPQITFTAASEDEGKVTDGQDENGSVTGNLPALTDESARASVDSPRTPADDGQIPLEDHQSEGSKSPECLCTPSVSLVEDIGEGRS